MEEDPTRVKSFAEILRGKAPPASANSDSQVRHSAPPASKPVAEAKKETVAPPQLPNCSICVRNVEQGTKPADLEAVFSPFGSVVQVDLNAARTVAFVDFASAETVQVVLTKHAAEPIVVNGKELFIEIKLPKAPRNMRSGGRGEGRGEGRGDGRDRGAGGGGERRGSRFGSSGGGGGSSDRRAGGDRGAGAAASGSRGGAGGGRGRGGKPAGAGEHHPAGAEDSSRH